MKAATADPLTRPWAAAVDEVADALGTDPQVGLAAGEAARRLAEVGPNELTQAAGPSAWRVAIRQLANTLTVVLAAAAGVTLAVGHGTDAAVIAVIVVLDGVVGFAQEHRAERAVAALRRLTADTATAVRDGENREVATAGLVPGDVVLLTAGDVVPADVRLVEAHGLRIAEAALTGESEPVAKTSRRLDGERLAVADRANVAFKGTVVTSGRGTGIVVATGMATELGRIAALLRDEAPRATPLQRRLAALGRWMATAGAVVCAAVFTFGVSAGEPAGEMFLTAVSLAVAAIPEGLPAVVTVALALGARRMADRRALIRRLPAVETLGSVTVICTDKTGTLTENRMMVERVWTPTGFYHVTGSGYAPAGRLEGTADPDRETYLARLARVAAACNDAELRAPGADGEPWTSTGDPTEAALLAVAAKAGADAAAVRRDLPRRAEIAFDATRRRMTTVHDDGGGGVWIATKGALDAVGPLLSPQDRDLLGAAEAAAAALADDGYRVLALADRHLDHPPAALADVEDDLRLAGLVGIADPPRPEAAGAVARCRAAGIAPVMITGDHPRTAAAIARRLGILDAGGEAVLRGDDLDALDDAALAGRLDRVRVFARTTPEHKLRIVAAWQARGAVVAMTGDGVNDAPALRRADIGVAMGRAGSDVSREAADMVLADDNFATIVDAVEEGRRIYDNIRRFVRYLLTTNSGELWVMLAAPLFGLPFPLLPIQILWINLVTDGLPAIGLGLEPAEADAMRRPPRSPQASILGGGLWQHALAVGLLMAAVVLPVEALARAAGWPWQTMVFTTLALLQLGNALAVRSDRESIAALGLRSNPRMVGAVAASAVAQMALVYVPALHGVFETEALTAAQLAVVLAASSAALVAVEIDKWTRRRRGEPAAGGAPCPA